MKAITTLSALFGIAIAQVSFDDWHPPQPGDLRGPCPGLNSLANHGILPRDGKDLTVPTIAKVLPAALNISVEVSTLLALAALRTSSDPTSNAFTLADLNKHNIIEHDGSLSRKDNTEVGEQQTFNKEIFTEFLSYFNESTQITLPAAAAARWGRIQTEKKRDPKFSYSATSRFNSYAETTIYMQVLGDHTTGLVPLEHLKVLFEQERFPYNEGWRPPVTPITGLASANVILQLALNTPEDAGDLVNPIAASGHARLL